MTLSEVVNILKIAGQAQPNIHTIEDDFLKLNREDTVYSAFIIQQREHQRVGDFINYSFYIGYVDRLTDDKSNEVDIHSTGINVLNSIVNGIRESCYPTIDIAAGRYITFNQRFTAECAGVYTDVIVSVPASDCPDFEFHFGGSDLRPLTVDRNGEYVPVGFDGYDKVTVQVEAGDLRPLLVRKNGSYTPEDFDGFSNVIVDVEDDRRKFILNGDMVSIEYDDALYELVDYMAAGGNFEDVDVYLRGYSDIELSLITNKNVIHTGDGEFISVLGFHKGDNICNIHIERYYDPDDDEYYLYVETSIDKILTEDSEIPAENVKMDFVSDLFDFDNVASGLEEIAASTEYLFNNKADKADIPGPFKTINEENIIGEGNIEVGCLPEFGKVFPYFYEVEYANLDYEYAKTHIGDPIYGGCTVVKKNWLIGRNYDWKYDNKAEFLVRTPAIYGRNAVMGICGGMSRLTGDFVDNLTYTDDYKLLPFNMLDGINDKGLYCSINVVPATGMKTSGGTNSICITMIVRYILDNFSTVDEVITGMPDVYNHPQMAAAGYEAQIFVADKNKSYRMTYDGLAWIRKSEDKMTNFHIPVSGLNPDGTVNTPETACTSGLYPSANNINGFESGLERWNVIVNSDKTVSELMKDLYFTNAYKDETSPAWYSEFVGGDFNVNTDDQAILDAHLLAAKAEYERRSRETGTTWHTVHSCVYNLGRLKLDITVQEDEQYTKTYLLNEMIPANMVESNVASDMFDFENVDEGLNQIVAAIEDVNSIKADKSDLAQYAKKTDVTEGYVVNVTYDSTTDKYDVTDQDLLDLKTYLDNHSVENTNIYLYDEYEDTYELVVKKYIANTYVAIESKGFNISMFINSGSIRTKHIYKIFNTSDELAGLSLSKEEISFITDGGVRGFKFYDDNSYGVYQNTADGPVKLATEAWVEGKGYGDVNHREENNQYLRQINPFDIQWNNKVKNTYYQAGPNGFYGKTRNKFDDTVGFIIEEGDGDLYIVAERGDDKIKIRPDGITFTDADGDLVVKKGDVVTKDMLDERIGALETITNKILGI